MVASIACRSAFNQSPSTWDLYHEALMFLLNFHILGTMEQGVLAASGLQGKEADRNYAPSPADRLQGWALVMFGLCGV